MSSFVRVDLATLSDAQIIDLIIEQRKQKRECAPRSALATTLSKNIEIMLAVLRARGRRREADRAS